MQLSDLYGLCQDQTGDTTAASLARFKKYLNIGKRIVEGSVDLPQAKDTKTLTFADGVAEYTLDATVSKLRLVRITQANYEKELREISDIEYKSRELDASGQSESQPVEFFISDYVNQAPQKIKVYPVPDKTYSAEYDFYALFPDMVEETDTPYFSSRWHHILVDFALSMYYEKFRDSLANYYSTKFFNALDELKANRFSSKNMPRIDYGTGVNE